MKLPLADLIELVKTFHVCVNSHFLRVGSSIYSKSGKYCPCSLSDFTTFFCFYQVNCWCFLHMAMQWWYLSCLFVTSVGADFLRNVRAFSSPFFSVVSVLMFSWPLTKYHLLLCQNIFLFILHFFLIWIFILFLFIYFCRASFWQGDQATGLLVELGKCQAWHKGRRESIACGRQGKMVVWDWLLWHGQMFSLA